MCRVVTVFKLYNDIEDAWNSYITDKHTPLTTLTTHTPLTTLTTSLKGIINENLSFFNKIDDSGLEGRILELSFPLLYIASILSEETFDSLLVVLKNLSKERNEEDVIENYDVSLIDFVSQEVEDGKFVRIKELVKNFKEYLQSDDEWINERWLGRGLKRLNLIKQKRRKSRGREVILDIAKAQKKIRMFR
ncbi:MAG: hypothetical protein IH845_05380 [Nanoarchaeota archaeon]|nr:hypothetical protein [Nanoarchaeota archaeon]